MNTTVFKKTNEMSAMSEKKSTLASEAWFFVKFTGLMAVVAFFMASAWV
ncbi:MULTISPECIES: hypothetical protein [unclassified Vibrio]|uniref:Uncharacterized protein n=1 Tax=Vibrio sp. HB236076 TaxID=3232307 RepID=A0AB39HF18_9VIBR|nr:hypothetical protein [Vibrio sp. HB161653]MDP5255426.1 hypothetical protein [Vibrio sp. HB161653]